MKPNHLGGQTLGTIEEEKTLFNALVWSGQKELAEELIGPAIADLIAYGQSEVSLDKEQTRTALTAIHRAATGRLVLLPGNNHTAEVMWTTCKIPKAARFGIILRSLLDV